MLSTLSWLGEEIDNSLLDTAFMPQEYIILRGKKKEQEET